MLDLRDWKPRTSRNVNKNTTSSQTLHRILHRGRWIATPFVTGSILFIAAVTTSSSNMRAAELLFLTGSSLYLTGASAEAWNARATAHNSQQLNPSAQGWTSYLKRRFTASIIQAIGAFLFQVMVIAALIPGLNYATKQALIWEPDIVGSACFVISCALLISIRHPLADRSNYTDHIKGAALYNLAGSVCFLTAAIGAFTTSNTGEPVSPMVAASATIVGSVFFLIGSWPGLPDKLKLKLANLTQRKTTA